MIPYNILSLLGLDSKEYELNPIVEHGEFIDYVYIKQNDTERICPNCGSVHCYIDGYRTIIIKTSILGNSEHPVFVKLKKIKYECVDCKHKFYKPTNFVRSGCTISNELCWQVYYQSKKLISFTTISQFLNISEPEVLNIFDKMVSYKRRKLSRCVAIDEKKFSNDRGKYVTIISNAQNGVVLDVIPGRTVNALTSVFDKIPQKELELVEFFTSDMYEGFRQIKQKYFPKAIHIIDHYHISKLFTETITNIRTSYMKRYCDDDEIYNFLKKKWMVFLSNSNNQKKNKNFKNKYSFNGHILDFNSAMKHIYSLCPNLAIIRNIYDEFNACFYNYKEVPDVESDLNYIIQKCELAPLESIQRIGTTLKNFYKELVNTFSLVNKFKITNAVAEGNNTFIDKIIGVSYGMTDFRRFRNRIMHFDRRKKREG